MALSITRNKSAINPNGGGLIKVQEVNEDGTVISGAPVIDLGYLKETSYTDKTPSEDLIDETGLPITPKYGNRSVFVTGTLMQSNKAVLDIPEEVRNKFYRLYKLNSEPGSLSAQEMFFGVGSITPQTEIKWMGGENPFEFRAYTVPSSVSISGVALTGSGTAGFGAYTSTTVTIPANKIRVIVETATPNGV